MPYNFTKPLTVNGMNNLLALLLAAGYQGPAIVQHDSLLYNTDGSVPAYLYFTDSNIYLPGVRQVETCVVVGNITTAGNSIWTITGAGLSGSPVTVNVNLELGWLSSRIAQAALNAINSNVACAAFADWSVNGANLICTKKVVAANDGTLNIAYADDTSNGLTDDASSNDTTAGALYTTEGMPILVDAPSNEFIIPKGADLSTTWIYSVSSISVKAVIIS